MPFLKLTTRPWKSVVGRWTFGWGFGLFPGANCWFQGGYSSCSCFIWSMGRVKKKTTFHQWHWWEWDALHSLSSVRFNTLHPWTLEFYHSRAMIIQENGESKTKGTKVITVLATRHPWQDFLIFKVLLTLTWLFNAPPSRKSTHPEIWQFNKGFTNN